jgi:hypothetical protein
MNATQLNKIHCSTPGCTCDDNEIYFHQRCHPEAALEAFYVKNIQRLYLICAECKQFISEIDVAD